MNLKKRNTGAFLLGFIGLFQIIGYILKFPPLRGMGAASMIAPFPKVFSDVDGLETFASEFTFVIQDQFEQEVEIPITPELYSQLIGPYNRRNVYGAALSYAPRMPQDLWEAVYCYGLKAKGPLRREFQLPSDAKKISVRIQTKTRSRTDVWILDPPCDP